jgi:hypothetical protein
MSVIDNLQFARGVFEGHEWRGQPSPLKPTLTGKLMVPSSAWLRVNPFGYDDRSVAESLKAVAIANPSVNVFLDLSGFEGRSTAEFWAAASQLLVTAVRWRGSIACLPPRLPALRRALIEGAPVDRDGDFEPGPVDIASVAAVLAAGPLEWLELKGLSPEKALPSGPDRLPPYLSIHGVDDATLLLERIAGRGVDLLRARPGIPSQLVPNFEPTRVE